MLQHIAARSIGLCHVPGLDFDTIAVNQYYSDIDVSYKIITCMALSSPIETQNDASELATYVHQADVGRK